MPSLFEKTSIKTLELKNRSVRSATWAGVGDRKGCVTDRATQLYRNLANGGVGLIVTGFQYVMPNGLAVPYQVGNYSDDLLEGLSKIPREVHANGGKVIAQLVHGGVRANPGLFFQEGEVWAPSAIRDPLTGNLPKEMTKQDIADLVEAYASAATRSQKAGFDGIQLHAAHGYGINQFLSGATNPRSDAYGGDISKRYRLLGEVLEAVRGGVGSDFPVFIKLSGADYTEGGLTLEESLQVARWLEAGGIDCIEVSGGDKTAANGRIPSRTNIHRDADEAYLAQLAHSFKETVNVPIVTVGGLRSPEVVNRILAEGVADYVAFCRPLIREPDLINRWKSGDTEKSKCISCNGCLETGADGKGVFCKADRKLKGTLQE